MSQTILLALAPVFFVLLLGYAAGRFRVADNHQVDGFNTLVMDFALPAALFVATASASRSETVAQAPFFGVLALVMLLLYITWFFAARAFFKTSSADASLQALTIAFPNFAGIGLPIASAVLGPGGAVSVAMALACGSMIYSPLTLILVELTTVTVGAKQTSTARRVLQAVGHSVTKPVVLAPALGVFLSLADVHLGPVVKASFMLIGHAAAGVALFLTGLILSAQPFRVDWRIIGATIMADVVRPLLMALVVFLLPIPEQTAKTAILLTAVPAGFFGILFGVNYRLDSAILGSMVLASTIFSIATLTFAIAVLFPH